MLNEAARSDGPTALRTVVLVRELGVVAGLCIRVGKTGFAD